jgi:mannose-6-phosphate isomerase-like protein (cupin superfamily)
MQVLKSKAAELEPEFGIMTGRWSQYAGLAGLPFDAMWCVVPPGGRGNTDCHPERELVVVVQGTLHLQASGREEVIDAGSAVLLDSSEEHVYVNPSEQDSLITLSVYWLPGDGGGQAASTTTGTDQ